MDIVDLVEEYAQGDSDLLMRAYIFTAKVHRGQSRVSGEPYISHPLEVARILAEMRQDPETVAAGILHDTVEDTSATLDEIQELFGEHVASLVNGVTKLARIDLTTTQALQAENYRKMLIAMAHDIRVIIIKLADRLHNALTLEYLPPKRRERIALETAEIYAPLANCARRSTGRSTRSCVRAWPSARLTWPKSRSGCRNPSPSRASRARSRPASSSIPASTARCRPRTSTSTRCTISAACGSSWTS
jgi:(p)ppGpp synthase/HD superfamily hydrolase